MGKERFASLSIILFIGLMTFFTFFMASQKSFWFDEILTLRVSEAAVGEDLWRAMTSGFEFNPPGAYIAVKASETIFRRGEISSRLPFIGASILTLCFMLLINIKHKDLWAGFWAVCFFVNTQAFTYFYEARGYSFVLCGAAMSWFAYDCLDRQGTFRYVRALCLFLGLSLALVSHMWSILLLPCFGAAILFDWWKTRKLDRGALIALAATSPLLLMYPPISASTKAFVFNNPIYKSTLKSLTLELLSNFPLLLLFLAIIFITFLPWAKRPNPGFSFQSHVDSKTILSTGFILTPFVLFLATSITGTPLMARYGLISTLGLAMLLSRVWSPIFQSSHQVVRIGLVLVAFVMTYDRVRLEFWQLKPREQAQLKSRGFGPLQRSDTPIFFANALDYLQAEFYAEPDLRRRFHFVADPTRSIRFSGTDGIDSALLAGETRLRLTNSLVGWDELQNTTSPFWLIDSGSPLNWLRPALLDQGWQLNPSIENRDQLVFAIAPQKTH